MNMSYKPKPFRTQKALNRLAWNIAILGLLSAEVAFLSGCGGHGDQTVQAEAGEGHRVFGQPSTILIPEGTTIRVRLLSSVSSSSARSGDEFDAALAEPLLINGYTVFDKNAPVRGQIVSARASGRLEKPGFLSLRLDAIENPDGRWDSVTTASITISGGSHKKRNATLIGGGTALGTIIGAIAGGGKGAAIGAVSGAGAGTAGAMATGKKDVTLPAERLLKFKSIGEITLSR